VESKNDENKHWDLIIIGSGPSGLSMAVFGGRAGYNILLLEQGEKIGPFAGGETLRYDPILDRLFGVNFLDALSQFRTWDTRIFSPNSLKLYTHHEKPGVNAFEWEDLMQAFANQLKDLSVQLKFNCQVKNLMKNGEGIVIGVQCESSEEFFGTTIIDASGANSHILSTLTNQNHKIGYPIVKSIVTDYRDTFQGFSSFFLMQGALDKFPQFPPITIFVFPHKNGRAEVGMMVFDDCTDYPDYILTDAEILDVWHELKINYPIFSKLVAESNVEYEYVTRIGSKTLIHEPVVAPGYIIIGAAGGFLEASHAAGLLTGIREAEFWVEFLKTNQCNSWNIETQQKANNIFHSSKLYRFVAKSHKKIQILKTFLYGKLKTEENFHRIWPLFVMGKKMMG
jgi:flavin-dependent dehydrogenase